MLVIVIICLFVLLNLLMYISIVQKVAMICFFSNAWLDLAKQKGGVLKNVDCAAGLTVPSLYLVATKIVLLILIIIISCLLVLHVISLLHVDGIVPLT
jgi:hypothetical protein